jgi:hypothetical protein
MTTNKAFQKQAISRMLKKQGIAPDLIDLDALIDSTLTLSENARIVREEVKFMQDFGANTKQETQSTKKLGRFLKAIEIFEKKSIKKQLLDSRRQARKTFEKSELTKRNFNKWKKHTNRYDILGVDSKY